jgi:hypothetical protein
MTSTITAHSRTSLCARRALCSAVVFSCGCSDVSFSKRNQEVQEPLILIETFVQSPMPKVDILWVVDNSPSMASEHHALQDAMSPFISQLDDAEVAWQIAVTTTDLGEMIPGLLVGDPWIMTPNQADPLGNLLVAVDVGTEGRGSSGGLAATVLALSEPLRSDENRGFRRAGASLHVIIFSDMDDQSSEVLGDDPTGAFLDFFTDEAELTGHPAQLSAIVGDPEVGCIGPGGAALPGDHYIEIAAATGGTSGSICQADFGQLLTLLGESSIAWPDHFELQATPVEDSIRVSVDGERLDSGWWLENDPWSIAFVDPPSPAAEIEVRYEVAP